MRTNIIVVEALVALFAGLLAVVPARAADEAEIVSSGSVCQPTTPADAANIEYVDGRAKASAPVHVTCPLPPIPPMHRQVRAVLYFNDFPEGRWKKSQCRFYNASSAHGDVPILPGPSSSRIGVATFDTDRAGFPVHTVVCNLLPGQSVYASTIVATPY